MTENWREYIPDFHYKQEDEYYYFPDDAELTFAEEKLVPVEASKKHRKSLSFQISRAFHRVVFTEGALGYRIARFIYRMFKKRKLAGRLCYFYERQVKRLLALCQNARSFKEMVLVVVVKTVCVRPTIQKGAYGL